MTAVELNQEGSELVACEMLLSGGFIAMPVEVIVSVMSCFTFDEGVSSDGGGDPASDAGLPPFLTDAYRMLQDCARIVAKASIECGVHSLTPGASANENSAMGAEEEDEGHGGAERKKAEAAMPIGGGGGKVSVEDFVNKFNPGLMRATYAWTKGAKFVEVQKLTSTFEGQTIRCLRRLEELVRQLGSAALAIGNVELKEKFEKGSELLRRDIVFCSSLYL